MRMIFLEVGLFFLLGIFSLLGSESDLSSGFAKRHDSARYGAFLVPKRIEGSLPSSDVCVHENYLYATGQGNLSIYQISNPVKPVLVARIENLGECRQLDYDEGIIYITARMNGMYVIDVRDPQHPCLRAHYDTIELATGIKCDRNVAYISQRQFGIEFVDIRDPSAPRHLGYVLSGEAQSVDVANGILYAGDWSSRELSIFDVRDSANPKRIGSASLGGLGDGVYVRDQLCYAATGVYIAKRKGDTPAERKGGHGLDIFSLEEPGKPQLLGRFDFPNQTVHYPPDFWSVEVNEKGIASVADTYNGFFCVDVSDPKRPKGVAYSILPVIEATGRPDPVGGVASAKGVFYLAGCHGGLYVVESDLYAQRISKDRNAPKLPDRVKTERVPVLKKEDPVFKTYRPGGQVMAAAIEDSDHLWIASGMTGLQLVDLRSDPPRPLVIFPTRGFAYDLKRVEDRLYVAEGDDGFAIYRVHPSYCLQLLARYTPPEPVRQIVVAESGRTAFVKVGNTQIHCLDLSQPTCPRVNFVDSDFSGILYGRDLVDRVVAGRFLVCVAHGTGLVWYDLDKKTSESRMITLPSQISFADGAAVMNEKLLFFKDGGYRFCTFNEEKTGIFPFVSVPGLPLFGKPSIYGRMVYFTDRREGTLTKIDFSDLNHPIIVKKYERLGHPESVILLNGKMIIPCGYSGLRIER